MPSEPRFNRVLLPKVPLFEDASSSAGFGLKSTGRLLPFLLEEFISHGAIEIIIEDPWRYEQELPCLPLAMRGHVKVSNSAKKSENIAHKLFEPFFEEFGLRAEIGTVQHLRPPPPRKTTRLLKPEFNRSSLSPTSYLLFAGMLNLILI